jgi:hypothetical protein
VEFEIYIKRAHTRFIGEKPEEDPISQLQMITQVVVKDGKAIHHTVEEHLDEFESLLELVQGEDNFSINVVDKAYNSLCRMTRDALFQDGYRPPVFTDLTSRQEQFEALAILRQRAINEEEKIKMMAR